MNNFNNLDKKIKYICNYEYKFFLNKANVIGLGLSFKRKYGFYTNKKCICVFVTNKVPKNNLSLEDIIPKYYKGIETDVIETEISKALSLTQKIRPVPGGYSIGGIKPEFDGSMGCIVTDGINPYVLSCSHVIAECGLASLDTPVLQPSLKFGGKIKYDEIAYLSKYIPFNSTNNKPNIVDCAMAEIKNPSLVDDTIAFLGKISGINLASIGSEVQKVGEHSELTKGKVTALYATTVTQQPSGKYTFKNQISTTFMALSGDSGAILLDMNMNALGLCMSGTSSQSFFNPIQEVLSSLGVTILFE